MIETAPERIWATHSETWGAVELGQWADTVRHKGGTEYVRADLLDDAVRALDSLENLTARDAAIVASTLDKLRSHP